MALDTQYRPLRFGDVLGQSNTVKVLQQFVQSGAGFHQSYLFCGGHGSGKTTLGRILARALLCDAPKDGNPCDECVSCRSLLERGSSECFTEFDAATNSGKDDIKKLTEAVHFDTFSGKRRIYLVDESHRLSPAALDALLKPMEDTAPGSQDKLLVCIFCTTEPEKMKSTIFSRCAPAFVIQNVTPTVIAERLAYVCQQEGIQYEQDALVLISEVSECHIRDALKSVEGVSMLGQVSLANVKSYLRLNANPIYLKCLYLVGRDLPRVYQEVEALQQVVSPTTAYERLSDLAVLSYRVHLGVGKPPSYWPEKAVRALGELHGSFLLKMAALLSSRPSHPTYSMLICDLSNLHFQRTGEVLGGVPLNSGMLATALRAAQEVTPQVRVVSDAPPTNPLPEASNSAETGRVNPPVSDPSPPPPKFAAPMVTKGGVYVDPRGINRREVGAKTHNDPNVPPPLEVSEFRSGLRRLVAELAVDGRGNRPT
jgi:DNA polymerase III subunit gamma/tau